MFTLWDHERLPGDRWEFPWVIDERENAAGRNEFKRVFDQSLAEGFDAFGVVCYAKDPLARENKRTNFRSTPLAILALSNERGRRSAQMVGEIEEQAARAAFEQFLSVAGSAENDLVGDPIGNLEPEVIVRSGLAYARDESVRRAVILRARGRCEYCGSESFKKDDGSIYLETHHIIHLSKKGPDTVGNVIALCPSHHREAHFGANRVELEKQFHEVLRQRKSKA